MAVGYEFNPGPDEVQTLQTVTNIYIHHRFCVSGVCVCPLWITFLCDFQGLIMLEKELAYLGSVCAAALMKKDLALPIGNNNINHWITNCADMYFIYSYNPQWLGNFKHRQTNNVNKLA